MTPPPPSAAAPAAAPPGDTARPGPPRRFAAPAWLREPLLHFMLLGAAVFAVDHLLVARADDPRSIVVGRAVVDEARTLFRGGNGRDPSPAELQVLTRRWLDNEILFREGMALQVDQGDAMIRDRVIFKALMVVESGLQKPTVDGPTLRAWFETQRAKYDEPARFDFQEAVLDGEASDAAARAFAFALNAGVPGDAKAGLRVFKGRPLDNLVQSYGAEFAQELGASPVGQWRALPTRDGVRVVRLDGKSPPAPASYETLRNVVLMDWTDATMAQRRTDAVRARGQKYRVRYEDAAR